MNIPDKLLNDFKTIVGASSQVKPKRTQAYGTIVESNGETFVKIDGSDLLTPFVSTVEVGDGDRVMITFDNHTAIITNNITTPAITRMGDVYIQPTDAGLVIGQLDESGEPTGSYILATPSGYELRDSSGRLLASFGYNAQIGRSDTVHTRIESGAYFIYDASGKPAVKISPNRIECLGVSGTTTRITSSASSTVDGVTQTVAGSLYSGAGVGLFGLYDEIARRWLISSDVSGNVRLFGTPVQLTLQSFTPTHLSDNYDYITAPNLEQWAVVVMYVIVGLNFESLVFINGGMQTRFISYYNGTRNIQGAFVTEWNNNRVGVRCSHGEGTDYEQITLQSVWGLIRK